MARQPNATTEQSSDSHHAGAVAAQADVERIERERAEQRNANGATETEAKPPATVDTFGTPDESDAIVIKRRVTIPVLPMPDDQIPPHGKTIVCQIVDPIRTGRVVEGSKYDKPAEICTIRAANGEHRTLVVNKVLQKELDMTYPDMGYVNKWFRLTKFRKGARKYATFEVIEIEPPKNAVAV